MLEGRVTLDQEERIDIYRRVGLEMREMLSWIPLYQAQDLYGVAEPPERLRPRRPRRERERRRLVGHRVS